MITIKGWHGKITSKSHLNFLNALAGKIIEPDYIWEFDGTLNDFSDKYPFSFLCLKSKENPTNVDIYVTQHGSFNQR